MAKKQGGFHPPTLIAGRDDNSFELGNLDLTDSQDLELDKYLKKTFLERQIEGVVRKWKLADKPLREAHKLWSNKAELKDIIKTFKRADRAVKQLRPWLREDSRVPYIRLEYIGQGKTYKMKATDYLCIPGEKGLLEWIATWLSEIKPLGGRIPEIALYSCAEELLALFKQKTGNYKWEKVSQILRLAFPGKYKDDADSRDWLKKLVKRHRMRKEKIQQMKLSERSDGNSERR